MRSFCVVFLVLSLTPAFAQQETGGNTGATTGTAQGNQAVQGQQIDAPEITGPEFNFGDAAEGGRQSAFQARETTAFGTGATSQSGGRGATRTFNTAGRGGTGRTSSTSTRARQVRPTFRLGFVPGQALSALSIGNRAKQRIASVKPRVRQLSGVSVNASQAKGVITLRGSVRSASAKRLAAALLRLEPGVRKVQNQLQVASAPVKPVAPATPPAPPTPPAVRPRQ